MKKSVASITLLFLALMFTACGHETTVVSTELADAVLSFHAGTAGSSLGRAIAATHVVVISSDQKAVSSSLKSLSAEQIEEFRENFASVAELINDTLSDPESMAGLYEDAGVSIDTILENRENWEKLKSEVENAIA